MLELVALLFGSLSLYLFVQNNEILISIVSAFKMDQL